MKIGDYEPRIVKKGEEETTLDVAEGECYWVVQIDAEGQFDVKTQFEAETISRLVLQAEELKVIKSIMAQKEKTMSVIVNDIHKRLQEVEKKCDGHMRLGDHCPHTQC